MKASSRVALPRCLTSSFGRADGEHPPLVHQRDAVAAFGLIHEVGREEDRDAIIAGEIDQRAPELVARDRIDARRRLVENEHRRPVQHGHCKLQPLLHAERQAFRLGVGHVFQIVAFEQLIDADLRSRSAARW